MSIDSENYLFKRLNTECPGAIPNLITRRQYNQRRKKTMKLGENIRQSIAKAEKQNESPRRRGAQTAHRRVACAARPDRLQGLRPGSIAVRQQRIAHDIPYMERLLSLWWS